MRGSLFISALAATATALVVPRQESIEATYDEACNIGYCSIMGATIGGWGGNYTTVSTIEQFSAAVAGTQTGVVLINGTLAGSGTTQITIGSSKSILGLPGSSLTGLTLHLPTSRNVILRNLRMASPPSSSSILLTTSRSIWIDHCDFSSSPSPSPSLQTPTSPLISITNASDYITITNNIFHSSSHPTLALQIGHSDANAAQDADKFHITAIGNWFRGVTSGVTFRFGTGHILNTLFDSVKDGINAQIGANLLVESVVFKGVTRGVYSEGSAEAGKATVVDAVLGGATSTAPRGEMDANSVPYPYDWAVLPSDAVEENVVKVAGAKLRYIEPINWGETEIAEREGRTPPAETHAHEDEVCED
ncbi:pectin lyase fold/virulence factor [Podospora aff. communis PSN243]|uniref:Pectin lyase fold/virulence factor n=1 Tax=Podospora aff. communis PSN243 TaxID=3040156 RepID=A0AAV9GSL3_9PEZI|nr:pectin lyase fold/virulence factor [Podospora aff. communis PSN243]